MRNITVVIVLNCARTIVILIMGASIHFQIENIASSLYIVKFLHTANTTTCMKMMKYIMQVKSNMNNMTMSNE